jgi:hypothetical protein
MVGAPGAAPGRNKLETALSQLGTRLFDTKKRERAQARIEQANALQMRLGAELFMSDRYGSGVQRVVIRWKGRSDAFLPLQVP